MTTKSKFFRVATEGATTDGRKIDRNLIEQVAASFNRKTYGARIWLEHIRGKLPDSPFKAYGDVTAVKAEEVDTDNGKRLALFAKIEPTPELIAINKARQKIYTSVEIDPMLADTGTPYLVGLGVTDSPASLGTEILTFSAQHPGASPLAHRKLKPENLFSEAVEVDIEFEEDTAENDSPTLRETVKNIIKKFSRKDTGDSERFADITEAVKELAEHTAQSGDQYTAALDRIVTIEGDLKAAKEEFSAFKTQMDSEEADITRRPPATGGNGHVQTEF